MNNAIAEFVTMWAVVNVAAMGILAVMAYVTSIFVLDWLEALERRLSGRESGVSGSGLPDAPRAKSRMDPGNEALSGKRPNKSPEPTRTAVTPRAIEMSFEPKQSKAESNEARVAPAVRVAHL